MLFHIWLLGVIIAILMKTYFIFEYIILDKVYDEYLKVNLKTKIIYFLKFIIVYFLGCLESLLSWISVYYTYKANKRMKKELYSTSCN